MFGHSAESWIVKAGVNIMLGQCNKGKQCQKEEVDFHCLFVFVYCLCFFLVMICDKIGLKFLLLFIIQWSSGYFLYCIYSSFILNI